MLGVRRALVDHHRLIVLRGYRFGLRFRLRFGQFGFQLGLDREFLGLDGFDELGLVCDVIRRVVLGAHLGLSGGVADGHGILLLMFAGHRRGGDETGAFGSGHQVIGPFLEERFAVVRCGHMGALQRRRILAALGSQQDVDHRADEGEGRGEDVDADTGDMSRGVVAHQLHPEPSDRVRRDIQREQPAMAQAELTVGPDQEDEHQYVPQQLVEERGMDDRGDLTGRDAVQRVDVHRPGGIATVEDLHAPRHGGLAAVQLLIEVVAQPSDGLSQHDPRRDGVAEGRQRNPPAAARDPRAHTAERDGAPDAQAAFPDLQRGTDAGTTLAEVGAPVGHQVVQPATDQTEGHCPQRDVVDDSALATTCDPPTVTDDQRHDDAGDDAQRVRPDRNRTEVPDALRGAGEVGKNSRRHDADTFSRTPAANSPVKARTAGTPSLSADTSAEPTMTPLAK